MFVATVIHAIDVGEGLKSRLTQLVWTTIKRSYMVGIAKCGAMVVVVEDLQAYQTAS